MVKTKEPVKHFFAKHNMQPISAFFTLYNTFGPDWLIWEPETLKSEILKTFNASSISEANWNKIQAIRTLLTSVGFWYEWHIFEKVIQALNNNIPDFSILQRCTVPQLMAGIDIASTIRKMDFSSEVSKYVASCAVEDGVTYLPDPLSFAQKDLSDPYYVCKDCGNIDYDDLEDGRCDFCSGRYIDQYNLNGKSAPWIPEDVGKNIE